MWSTITTLVSRPCQDDQLYGVVSFEECDSCPPPIGSAVFLVVQSRAQAILLGAWFYRDYDRVANWFIPNLVLNAAEMLQSLPTDGVKRPLMGTSHLSFARRMRVMS